MKSDRQSELTKWPYFAVFHQYPGPVVLLHWLGGCWLLWQPTKPSHRNTAAELSAVVSCLLVPVPSQYRPGVTIKLCSVTPCCWATRNFIPRSSMLPVWPVTVEDYLTIWHCILVVCCPIIATLVIGILLAVASADWPLYRLSTDEEWYRIVVCYFY